MSTTLLNSSGEEVARTDRIRRQISSSISRHREMSGGGLILGTEELHHSQGDPHDQEEKCRIM